MNAPQPSEQARREQQSAQKLVTLSHIFGWGGLGVLFVLAPVFGIALRSGTLALIAAAIGAIAAVAGAVLGQIGRGMQGRVI
jgi:hypothetical protein